MLQSVAMNHAILGKIVMELDSFLHAGIISKIHQPDEKNLLLKIFIRGKEHSLVISAHHKFSRLHLTVKKFPNPPRPLRFCSFLRSRIEGARIEGLTQTNGERIIGIKLKNRDGEYTLVCELTGKSGNLILIDKDGVVLDALRHFPKGSTREVAPGVKLDALTKPEILKEREAPFDRKPGETWNQAADRYYSEVLEKEGLGEKGRSLRHTVAGAEKKAKRKLENLFGDKKKALSNAGAGKFGELILANFKKIKKGMSEAVLKDLYASPPVAIKILLDPRLSPQGNAAKYFKRAKKANTALSMLDDRILDVEKEIEYLEGLIYECENMENMADAEALADEAAEAGYLKKEPSKKEGAGKQKTEPMIGFSGPIRKFTSKDGFFKILCGKSGKANDQLVKQYAEPHDVWLHAKNVPGAHVLLKTAGKTPPPEVIEEAAKIAALHSKASTGAKAEVIYTEAKNVKKPKGARPGMVAVREYKTIIVKLAE